MQLCIEVRTDTTKLTNMIITKFGGAEIWLEKVRCLSKINSKDADKVVVLS